MPAGHEHRGRPGIQSASRTSLGEAVAGAARVVGTPSFYAPAHSACAGTTKQGTACQARPARGTEYCIGHLRARGED